MDYYQLLSTIIHYYPRTLFIAIPFLSTKKRGHSIRSHSTSAVVQTSQDFFCKMTSDCTSTNYFFQIERQQCFLIVPLLFSMSSKNLLYLRGEIYPCRHCRQQCKIFASGVNFSRNNAIYNINESTFYPDIFSKTVDLLLISPSITKKCPNY